MPRCGDHPAGRRRNAASARRSAVTAGAPPATARACRSLPHRSSLADQLIRGTLSSSSSQSVSCILPLPKISSGLLSDRGTHCGQGLVGQFGRGSGASSPQPRTPESGCTCFVTAARSGWTKIDTVASPWRSAWAARSPAWMVSTRTLPWPWSRRLQVRCKPETAGSLHTRWLRFVASEGEHWKVPSPTALTFDLESGGKPQVKSGGAKSS